MRRCLIDTNVLLRLCQSSSMQYGPALHSIQCLKRDGFELVVVPQCLYEFHVVATRPKNVNGLGIFPEDMPAYHSEVLFLTHLLPDQPLLFEQWRSLIFAHRICGKSAHDARLVAAMQLHFVTHLLTFNVDDFTRFAHLITILDPRSFPS